MPAMCGTTYVWASKGVVHLLADGKGARLRQIGEAPGEDVWHVVVTNVDFEMDTERIGMVNTEVAREETFIDNGISLLSVLTRDLVVAIYLSNGLLSRTVLFIAAVGGSVSIRFRLLRDVPGRLGWPLSCR